MSQPSHVSDIVTWMDRFAPPSLAESWDNVGLLFGDPQAEIARIMTCLTVTPETAAEAIEDGVGLIVSHHPILFRAVKSITARNPEGMMLWSLARAGVAVYSPHTAFDNCVGGINDMLAERLDLRNVRPLKPGATHPQFKIVVFAPRSDRDVVLDAAFGQGAGIIGNYTECSYSSAGHGTFFGQEGANPTVGQAGRRESAREYRVEILCPGNVLAQTLAAIREAHSYEEPAIDVYPLHGGPAGPGVGRVGNLPTAEPLSTFVERIRDRLAARRVDRVGPADRPIRSVAIVCGAGDDFLPDARRAGADVLLTGEARFHRALEAEASGIALVLAGHHATERIGVEGLALRLAEAFPGLTVQASRREHDPLM